MGIALVFIGFSVGCFGTIAGIGGGAFIVPILSLYYGWDSGSVVATSLFVVVLTSASGSVGYARQKRIDYTGGIKFSLAALPGAALAAFAHQAFDADVFKTIFAAFMLFMALYSLLKVRKFGAGEQDAEGITLKIGRHVHGTDKFGAKFNFYVNDKLGMILNMIVGFISSFLGIGGGVFKVPILVFLLRYPAHMAAATSQFAIMVTCIFALIPHFFMNNVHYNVALPLAAGAVAGAQAGAFISPRFKAKFIICLFAAALIAVALKMILS